jgi:hypothetical protein
LTVRLTNRAGTKVGYSDPVILCGKGHRSTNKRYAGDVRQEVAYMNESDEISPFLPVEMLLPSGAAYIGVITEWY